jgi:hypothetical protein
MISQRNINYPPAHYKILIVLMMIWAGYVARMGEKKNAYRIFVGKSEGKRPLGRP